jgi:hypothetical protein
MPVVTVINVDACVVCKGKSPVEIVNLASVLSGMSAKLGGKHRADDDLADALDKKMRLAANKRDKKRIGVLISGSGLCQVLLLA